MARKHGSFLNNRARIEKGQGDSFIAKSLLPQGPRALRVTKDGQKHAFVPDYEAKSLPPVALPGPQISMPTGVSDNTPINSTGKTPTPPLSTTQSPSQRMTDTPDFPIQRLPRRITRRVLCSYRENQRKPRIKSTPGKFGRVRSRSQNEQPRYLRRKYKQKVRYGQTPNYAAVRQNWLDVYGKCIREGRKESRRSRNSLNPFKRYPEIRTVISAAVLINFFFWLFYMFVMSIVDAVGSFFTEQPVEEVDWESMSNFEMFIKIISNWWTNF